MQVLASEIPNWSLSPKFLKSALQSGNEILSDLNNESDVILEKFNSVLPGETKRQASAR